MTSKYFYNNQYIIKIYIHRDIVLHAEGILLHFMGISHYSMTSSGKLKAKKRGIISRSKHFTEYR
jgi:hypothetical protein